MKEILKRIGKIFAGIILIITVVIFAMVFIFILTPFYWIVTGKNLFDQPIPEWLQNLIDNYK